MFDHAEWISIMCFRNRQKIKTKLNSFKHLQIHCWESLFLTFLSLQCMCKHYTCFRGFSMTHSAVKGSKRVNQLSMFIIYGHAGMSTSFPTFMEFSNPQSTLISRVHRIAQLEFSKCFHLFVFLHFPNMKECFKRRLPDVPLLINGKKIFHDDATVADSIKTITYDKINMHILICKNIYQHFY